MGPRSFSDLQIVFRSDFQIFRFVFRFQISVLVVNGATPALNHFLLTLFHGIDKSPHFPFQFLRIAGVLLNALLSEIEEPRVVSLSPPKPIGPFPSEIFVH